MSKTQQLQDIGLERLSGRACGQILRASMETGVNTSTICFSRHIQKDTVSIQGKEKESLYARVSKFASGRLRPFPLGRLLNHLAKHYISLSKRLTTIVIVFITKNFASLSYVAS